MFGTHLPQVVVLLLCAVSNVTHSGTIKSHLEPEDFVYTLPEGVMTREVTYFSDDVACYAKLFFPKGFSTAAKRPAVVLVQGWGYTHVAAEKYAARFAGKGMVAMVIDYRGWGQSNGFTTLANKSLQARAPNDDAQRVTRGEFDIETKRTRLIPLKQVEDVRNAISYLQGEPGVDQEQIGLWGSGFGGGDAIVVAALDARVKAIAMQAPSIAGKGVRYQPYRMTGAILEDAIQRARNGQGAEMPTNHLGRPTIDVETKQMVAEYQPFHSVRHMRERPVLFVIAADDELFDNREHAIAAAAVLDGPKRVIRVPDTTHFEMYVGPAFEMSANAAAEWFVQYLGKNQTNLAR